MKVGDVIEVREFEKAGLFIREVWRPAIVTLVGETSIAVKQLRGTPFSRLLAFADRGNTWR